VFGKEQTARTQEFVLRGSFDGRHSFREIVRQQLARNATGQMSRRLAGILATPLRENGVAIAQQVARELIKGKSFTQLLSRPFRRRMRGHVEVDNATPVMGQHQKHVKNLETDGRHGKEVDGDQLLQVILQESAPGL
jgi:hypothetical protein